MQGHAAQHGKRYRLLQKVHASRGEGKSTLRGDPPDTSVTESINSKVADKNLTSPFSPRTPLVMLTFGTARPFPDLPSKLQSLPSCNACISLRPRSDFHNLVKDGIDSREFHGRCQSCRASAKASVLHFISTRRLNVGALLILNPINELLLLISLIWRVRTGEFQDLAARHTHTHTSQREGLEMAQMGVM